MFDAVLVVVQNSSKSHAYVGITISRFLDFAISTQSVHIGIRICHSHVHNDIPFVVGRVMSSLRYSCFVFNIFGNYCPKLFILWNDILPTVPTDILPTDILPTDILPTDILPTDILPTDILPTDILPTDILLTDILPTDILPTDILPTGHLANWTPCRPDTLPTGHLAGRTPCRPDTLPAGHLADRTPCRPDTLPAGHLADRLLADGHLADWTVYNSDFTKPIRNSYKFPIDAFCVLATSIYKNTATAFSIKPTGVSKSMIILL